MLSSEGSNVVLGGGDVALAVLTWVVGVIIRGIVIGSHFPALTRLGYGMTKSDAAVCWWGGLHGGVGLALAMSMEHELREAGQAEHGMRVLLHVSVAAMLTLLVNAPTMAPLLKKLGLTSTSKAKQDKFKELRHRVSAYAWTEYNKLLEDDKLAPQSVRWRQAVTHVIHVMEDATQQRPSLMMQAQMAKADGDDGLRAVARQPSPSVPSASTSDYDQLLETRRAFLGLVSSAYNAYLEEGVLPSRSSLAVDLRASIAWAHDHIDEPLADWGRLSRLALKIPLGTRVMLACLKPLWCIRPLKRWLVSSGPDAYAEHVAFALTAFIGAHTQAQEELRWMFGSKADALNTEQEVVAAESAQCVYKAKVFLYELHRLVVGEHIESDDDVIDYVKARQVAGVLLHRISIFIEKLQRHGVLDDWMAEELLHEVEHDEIALRAHLKKLSAREGVSEDAQLAESLARVAQVHELYLQTMRQEGVDVEAKKGLKDKLKPDMNHLKKKKHLPGQKSTSTLQVQLSTESATAPPPPPGAAPPLLGGDLLPPGWVASTDAASGNVYYVNSSTGQTQWTVPTV